MNKTGTATAVNAVVPLLVPPKRDFTRLIGAWSCFDWVVNWMCQQGEQLSLGLKRHSYDWLALILLEEALHLEIGPCCNCVLRWTDRCNVQ